MKKFNIVLVLIIVVTSIGYYGTYQVSSRNFEKKYKIGVQQKIVKYVRDSIQKVDADKLLAASKSPEPKIINLFPRYIWRVLESWEYGNDTDDPGVYRALCNGIVFMDNKFYPIILNKKIDNGYPRSSFGCDTTIHYKNEILTGGAFGKSSFWTEEEAKAEVINRIRKVIKNHEHIIDKIIAL
jgi:hypothetical protein